MSAVPWVLGGAALIGVLIVSLSFLTPAGLLIAVGLFVVGMLVLLLGKILLVVNAFQEDATQGLLVLFVPIYPLYYLFSRWPKTSSAVWVHSAGAATALLAIPASVGGLFATGRWIEESAPAAPVVAAAPAAPVQVRPVQLPETPAQRSEALGHKPDVPVVAPPARRKTVASEPAETITVELAQTNGFFDATADSRAALERELIWIDGYVPGSAAIDWAAGTVTLQAPNSIYTNSRLQGSLFRIGLVPAREPRTTPWVDPMKPRTITFEIQSTNGRFDASADPTVAAEKLLATQKGYVSNSLRVDLKAKTVTFEALQARLGDQRWSHVLYQAGFNTRQR